MDGEPTAYVAEVSEAEADPDRPRRFRFVSSWDGGHYGVYFPQTDLAVSDMGGRSVGKPHGVEWLD